MKIHLGISTCPNDTFAFHALMHGRVDTRGIEFQVELLDIQQLNDGLLSHQFEVIKASFAASLTVSSDYWVLPSGSALGFGVGPLLLAARPEVQPAHATQLTLCPGKNTTAALLFRMFFNQTTRVEHVVFSEIIPGLQCGRADFGVCIHEGRFTWQSQNVYLVTDLGSRWEQETQCPLPLGGIFASRELESQTIRLIQATLRDSILYAQAHPEEALVSMRAHAQEFDDAVLMQHVDLYVNQWTLNLGSVGQKAIHEFSQRARACGIPCQKDELTVFPG